MQSLQSPPHLVSAVCRCCFRGSTRQLCRGVLLGLLSFLSPGKAHAMSMMVLRPQQLLPGLGPRSLGQDSRAGLALRCSSGGGGA